VVESTAPGARRWTPAAAARRALEVVRTEGPRSLLFRTLAETVYRRLLIFELELGRQPTPPPAASELSFGWLGESRLRDYERLRPGHEHQARARLHAGDRCFATWLDGELVAVRWLATGSATVEYLDLVFPLEDGDVYHYDSFTSPRHRRRGLSVASQARLTEALRSEGRRRIVRAVLPENRAAVRDAEKAGFRRAGRIGFVRAGPWRREASSRWVTHFKL
jgi:RimJ/RimL family protein N-acetyltransferase